MGSNEFKLRNNYFRVQIFSPKADLIKLFGSYNLIVDFNSYLFHFKAEDAGYRWAGPGFCSRSCKGSSELSHLHRTEDSDFSY